MLKNKVALVTGASSGIGRAIALVWAREGAKVVVSDVNVQAGEETAALVCAAGGDAIFVAADVGKPEDCDALVNRTVAHYGRLDIACNNAGIGGPQAAKDGKLNLHLYGHIQGSITIPLNALPSSLAKLEKYRKKPVVVICAAGRRSAAARPRLSRPSRRQRGRGARRRRSR